MGEGTRFRDLDDDAAEPPAIGFRGLLDLFDDGHVVQVQLAAEGVPEQVLDEAAGELMRLRGSEVMSIGAAMLAKPPRFASVSLTRCHWPPSLLFFTSRVGSLLVLAGMTRASLLKGMP